MATKVEKTILKTLKQILKNQERPSFMEKDKMSEIHSEIHEHLDEKKKEKNNVIR